MVAIREARAEEAADLARMISNFNVEEGSPGRLDATDVGELCFQPRSRYVALVAEVDDRLVGYALIMDFFDTEPCAWCSYMQDLYVVPDWRSRGVGERLIAAAARYTLEEGRHELAWHVRDRNSGGRAFYARIGGVEQPVLPVTLSGQALKKAANGGS